MWNTFRSTELPALPYKNHGPNIRTECPVRKSPCGYTWPPKENQYEFKKVRSIRWSTGFDTTTLTPARAPPQSPRKVPPGVPGPKKQAKHDGVVAMHMYIVRVIEKANLPKGAPHLWYYLKHKFPEVARALSYQ